MSSFACMVTYLFLLHISKQCLVGKIYRKPFQWNRESPQKLNFVIKSARTKRNFLELLEFYSPNCFSSLLIEQLNRVGRSNNRLGGIYIDNYTTFVFTLSLRSTLTLCIFVKSYHAQSSVLMFYICSLISSSHFQTDFFLKNPCLLDKKEKVNIISFEFEFFEEI